MEDRPCLCHHADRIWDEEEVMNRDKGKGMFQWEGVRPVCMSRRHRLGLRPVSEALRPLFEDGDALAGGSLGRSLWHHGPGLPCGVQVTGVIPADFKGVALTVGLDLVLSLGLFSQCFSLLFSVYFAVVASVCHDSVMTLDF